MSVTQQSYRLGITTTSFPNDKLKPKELGSLPHVPQQFSDGTTKFDGPTASPGPGLRGTREEGTFWPQLYP